MKDPKGEIHHLAYIDAIRGLAFMAVFALHSSNAVAFFPGKWLFQNGRYGVQLFFLASAITLCYSASERQHRDQYPWLFFYIRRLFRIAPLFWLAACFYWMVPGPIGDAERRDLLWWSPTGIHPWHFLLTALFLHGWNPYTFNSVVPGGWSIAVEMTFYLFFPLIFTYVNSLQRSVIIFLGYFALTPLILRVEYTIFRHCYSNLDPFIVSFFQDKWFPLSLPIFLIGFCTYYFLRGAFWSTLRKSRLTSITFFISSALIFVHLLHRQEEDLLIAIAMAAIIVSMSSPRLPLVVNPILCYIGKISYSCYLAHFFMIECALYLLKTEFPSSLVFVPSRSSWEHLDQFLLIFLIALPLTLLASTVTYHLVEKPGISMGRRIIQRIEKSSQNNAVHA